MYYIVLYHVHPAEPVLVHLTNLFCFANNCYPMIWNVSPFLWMLFIILLTEFQKDPRSMFTMFEGFQPKPLTVFSRQGQKLQYCTIGKQILEVADGPEMQWHSCKLSKLLALFFFNIATFLETHFGNHNYLTVSNIHPSLLATKVLLDYLTIPNQTNPIPSIHI